jgi:hypothetical protein
METATWSTKKQVLNANEEEFYTEPDWCSQSDELILKYLKKATLTESQYLYAVRFENQISVYRLFRPIEFIYIFILLMDASTRTLQLVKWRDQGIKDWIPGFFHQ